MDVKRRSPVVFAALLACGVLHAQETLFEDAFERATSAGVGNGWIEIEASGAAVGISNGALTFLALCPPDRRCGLRVPISPRLR